MTSFIPAGKAPTLRPGVRAGDTLYISGQVGQVDFTLVDGGFEPQFRQAMENIRKVVEQHGGKLSDVIKINLYYADIDDFWPGTEIYRDYFEPGAYPARTAIAAAALPFGALVEIEGVAYLGS